MNWPELHPDELADIQARAERAGYHHILTNDEAQELLIDLIMWEPFEKFLNPITPGGIHDTRSTT